MNSKILIELHQDDDFPMPIDDRRTDIAIVNVKVYDRDGLGLPPVIVLQQSDKNESLNIDKAMDKITEKLASDYNLERHEIICFQETKKHGLQRIRHAIANAEITPEHYGKIRTNEPATSEHIEKELLRGLATAFVRTEKIELTDEQSNLPTLESIGLRRKS